MKRSLPARSIVSSLWIVLAASLAAAPASAQSEGTPTPEAPPAGDAAQSAEPASETPAEEPVAEEVPAPPVAEPAAVLPVPPPGSEPIEPESGPDQPAEAEVPEPVDPAGTFEFTPGQGIHIRSGDRRWELAIRARAQFLGRVTNPDGGDAGLDVELRRARIYFQGSIFDPNLRYLVQLGVSPSGSDMAFVDGRATYSPLLDWYLESRHLRDLNVRLGQMVTTYSREFTTGDATYQMIDRAIASAEFNLDRDFALEFRSTDFLGLGFLRYYAGISSGQGRDQPIPPNFGLMYYGRIEVLPMGMFDDYVQGDLARNHVPHLSLGAAYAFLDRAHGERGILGAHPADGGTTDMHNVTADAVFMWEGLSLTYEFLLRQGERHSGHAIDPQTMMEIPTAAPRNGYGMYVMAGYLLPDLPLELAARWSMVRPLGDGSALTERNELSGGLNWYIEGHAFKAQLWFEEIWGQRIEQGEERVLLQIQATL